MKDKINRFFARLAFRAMALALAICLVIDALNTFGLPAWLDKTLAVAALVALAACLLCLRSLRSQS